MAKKKGQRVKVGLVCTVCNSLNYTTEKSKINSQSGLKLMKYCPKCRKHTEHKEKKKLH